MLEQARYGTDGQATKPNIRPTGKILAFLTPGICPTRSGGDLGVTFMPKSCSARDLRWSGSRRAQSEANAAWSKLQKSQRKKKPSKSKRKNHRLPGKNKVNYRKYIKSKAWQHIRVRAIEHAGGQCRKCGSRMNLQVHHIHYKTLGRERLTDLAVMCRQCHADGHLAEVLGFDDADEMWRFAGLT